MFFGNPETNPLAARLLGINQQQVRQNPQDQDLAAQTLADPVARSRLLLGIGSSLLTSAGKGENTATGIGGAIGLGVTMFDKMQQQRAAAREAQFEKNLKILKEQRENKKLDLDVKKDARADKKLELDTVDTLSQIRRRQAQTAADFQNANLRGQESSLRAQELEFKRNQLQALQESRRKTLEVRKNELSLKQSKEERIANKLTTTGEKILDEAQTKTIDAQNKANKFEVYAQEVKNNPKFKGGLWGQIKEGIKDLSGNQDEITNLKKQFMRVRASQAIKHLPKGNSSDTDVALGLSGFPGERANDETVAKFFDDTATMLMFEAGFNLFKSDFISKHTNTRGMLGSWKKPIKTETYGDTSMAEIYKTAIELGTTPERVMQEIGLDPEDFK